MQFNANLSGVAAPPIADVQNWVAGMEFSDARPLLDVAQAVPSYRPAAELEHYIGELGRREEMSRYTAILGIESLRKALAEHFSEDYRADIAPEAVAVTAGCNQAFCIASSALAGPGDEVILPLPYYFNHYMWLKMQGIEPVLLPMPKSGPVAARAADVARLMTPRTRAIVIVNPSNPTGLELQHEELAALFDLAAAQGAALILDETYKDFRAHAGPPHRLFQDQRWPDVLVHLWSFSKSYSLTGYRVGSLTCGPKAMVQMQKIMDCVAICAARISQEAALFGLRHLAGWRDEKAAMVAQRRAALLAAFRERNIAYELLTCGAFFAYLRHPFAEHASSAVAKWLATKFGVMCVPGDMFGPGQEGFLRLAFANLETAQVPGLAERLIESQLQDPGAP